MDRGRARAPTAANQRQLAYEPPVRRRYGHSPIRRSLSIDSQALFSVSVGVLRRSLLHGRRVQAAVDKTVDLLKGKRARQVEVDDGAPLDDAGAHFQQPLLQGVEVGLLQLGAIRISWVRDT